MILAFVLNFMAVAIFVLIDFKYIHIFEQVMILFGAIMFRGMANLHL